MPDIISIFVNFKVTHDDAVLFPVALFKMISSVLICPKLEQDGTKNVLNAARNETIQTFQKSVYK